MRLFNIFSKNINSVFLFIGSRYLGYIMLIIRSLLIAKFLGPHLFGVYGFLLLVLMYLSFLSFGFQYAIIVKLSTEQADDTEKKDKTISVALTYTFIIAFALTFSGIILSIIDFDLFSKYSFGKYVVAIGAIAGLNHCWEIYKNIYRVFNKLGRIALSELINVFLLLSVVFIFKGDALIYSTLIVMILSGLINIFLFTINAPFKFKISFDLIYMKEFLKIGMPLLIVAISSYLITLAPRTIVSIFYNVETMGYYSFANSITNSVMLGLNTIAWVFFPAALSKTHGGITNEEATKSLSIINNLYGTSVLIAIFSAMLLLPLLYFYLPSYEPSKNTLYILMLAQAVLAVSFGSNSLTIARKKQLEIAIISIVSFILVIALSVSSAMLGLSLEWIGVSVLIGSFTFTLLLTRTVKKLLKLENNSTQSMAPPLSLSTIFPILVALIGCLLNFPFTGSLIAFIIYFFANMVKIQFLYLFASDKCKSLIKTIDFTRAK